ncbi:MAG: hypothetical protein ACE5J7_00400 [Candidatus Aenigmatarchaeota archaeon]
MAGKMSLRNIDIMEPSKEEAKFILSLLDEESRKYPKTIHVVVQEYHPNAGCNTRIRTIDVARDLYNQREHAPYVSWFATREYYEKIVGDT